MDQRLYQKTREIAEPEAYENYVKQKVRACAPPSPQPLERPARGADRKGD